MLVDFKSILERAQKGGFAIPAFNVYNMETVMGAIAAAEEAHAPVILQAYSRLFHNEEGYFLAPIVLAAAQQASVPVCFHIDHGAGEFEVTRALRYGVSGAMIDASALPYEENVALTRRVVETAAAVGVQVEGELGHIGSVNDNAMDEFTNPAQAADFAQKTGVAALAVLVGNAHGRYKKPPKLDIARIAEICEATGHLPLVLHGGTGIPADQIKKAISLGVSKINVNTECQLAFAEATRKYIEAGKDLQGKGYDPRKLLAPGFEAIKATVKEKMELFGSVNKA